jgi:hypothetical protein
MTKLLEKAIEQLRELPEDEQDAAAHIVFAYIASEERQYVLRPEKIAKVRTIRAKLNAGVTRLATFKEVATVRKKPAL